jgi:hypothetical protein
MSNLPSNEKEAKPRYDIVELIAHAMYMDTEKPFSYHDIYKPIPVKEVKKLIGRNKRINKIASDLAYYIFAAVRSGMLAFGQPYTKHFFVSKRFIPSAFMNAISHLLTNKNFMYAVNLAARKYKINIETKVETNKKGKPVIYFIVD